MSGALLRHRPENPQWPGRTTRYIYKFISRKKYSAQCDGRRQRGDQAQPKFRECLRDRAHLKEERGDGVGAEADKAGARELGYEDYRRF